MRKKALAAMAIMLVGISPLSTFAVYENLTEQQAGAYYTAFMGLGALLFLLVAGGMLLFWRYVREHSGPVLVSLDSEEGKKAYYNVLTVIGIGLVVRLITSLPYIGYANDVALFQYWADVASNDIFNTYNLIENIDYPPGYVCILAIFGGAAKLFGFQGTVLYNMFIKMPAILCDCGIALFIWHFSKKRAPKQWCCFFVSLWMFNPLAFLDSTVWGQVDSVLTLALVAGLYLVMKKRFIWASVIFGFGIMLKPQAIIVLPVLAYALFKNKKIRRVIGGFFAGIGTAVAVAFPFGLCADLSLPHMSTDIMPILEFLGAEGGGLWTELATPFAWIVSLFMGTTGYYSYASVNALNFFFGIGGNWIPDNTPFMGLNFFLWGMIFIVIAAAFTWFLYIKTKDNKSLPFIASAVILLLVVNFGPRMHERYFFPAVVLLLVAAILRNNRTLLFLFLGLTVSGYFSVLEIFVDLNLGIPYMWPDISVIRLILSWLNVLLALATAVFAFADAFGKIDNTFLDKKIWRMDEYEKELKF